MNLPVGTLLQGGKYRIVKKLGQGTFGITYQAEMKVQGKIGTLDFPVAIKEFFMKEKNERRSDGSVSCSQSSADTCEYYRKKFRQEAENLSKMKHDNIVRVSDIFDENNTTYYVMELVAGTSLESYIKERHGLPEREALSILREAGEAVSYMHSRRMLHLDIKPNNIMRRDDGHIYLIDFGLSKQFKKDGEPEQSTSIGLGTNGYAPPEQSGYKPDGSFLAIMDVYALGGTLYKMLTGDTPPSWNEIFNDGFDRKPLERKNVSRVTISVIEKAMELKKAGRYQTVQELLSALPVIKEEEEAEVIDTSEEDTIFYKEPSKNTIKGHEYVDLGLSVKWATCNVGASSPNGYGSYFAWGETSTKSTYTGGNSKTYGKSIGDIKGNSSYDAARANWGGSWRLPTEPEFQELLDNCDSEWTTQNGVKGRKFTSKKNGKSIFLPAAGWRLGSSLDYVGESGYYWSSTPVEGSTDHAYSLWFYDSGRHVGWGGRFYGRSVRPVSE